MRVSRCVLPQNHSGCGLNVRNWRWSLRREPTNDKVETNTA